MTTVRLADSPKQLDDVEPLWNALQEHHSEIVPSLGGVAPGREPADAWRRRRAMYESWLEQRGTFLLIAEKCGHPVGYAFVTIRPGYAAWETDERLAELATLSVLPEHRRKGIGAALLHAVWAHLASLGVSDLVITAALANHDVHRFYENHGFSPGFVVYYGRRPS